MRISAKKTIFFVVAAICGAAIFAEEAIELPDVTTVVSGGAITAGKDSVPDYSPTLPTSEDGRVSLPQIADNSGGIVAPVAETEPVSENDTKFRLGGGFYTGFPLGDDLMRERIALGFAGELPFTTFGTNKEFGGALRLLLGGVIGKEDVSGGFAGELSAELYFRLPATKVVVFQPGFGYGLSLTRVNEKTFLDSDLLLACSARFIPQGILGGALEFSLAPTLHWMPFSENAIFALGIRLGALYSFKK